jgi:hypothetical protein
MPRSIDVGRHSRFATGYGPLEQARKAGIVGGPIRAVGQISVGKVVEEVASESEQPLLADATVSTANADAAERTTSGVVVEADLSPEQSEEVAQLIGGRALVGATGQ